MLTTPKVVRSRPSIGEHSRALSQSSRVRAQSPGASSAASHEDLPPKSPRRIGGHASVGAVRQSIRGAPISRNSRDPRPIGDRGFAAQCARNVVDLLVSRGYSKTISHEKLLKDPSTKEFFDIFRYLIAQLDPQLEVDGKMEDEVPSIMRRLRYPVEVNRSKLQAISGPNTWPQLLAVLDWLCVLVRINDEYVEPICACQLGLHDPENPERDDGDHHLLRTLHENYLQYLSGRDDKSDEERLRQIYEERISALRGEIDRLRDHHEGMEQRLQEFRAEREHLVELQKAPAQLEVEAERLRVALQSAEMRVQRAEEETGRCEAEDGLRQKEVEDLQAQAAKLTEQVDSQAYSKQDIERLKWERQHLRQVLKDVKADGEKAEQDVWELNMQESRRAEAIERLVRQVNGAVEALERDAPTEAGVDGKDLIIRVDLSEPSDALAAQDFEELRAGARASTSAMCEAVQAEEVAAQDVMDEQRTIQEELAERERECKHLKARVEQLARMREDYREWSVAQLDEAQRTAEATEDEVHALCIGSEAPTIKDAAEMDKLRLTLGVLKEQGANERTQLEEQLRREEERFHEHRKGVQRELDTYVKATEALYEEVETVLEDGSEGGGALARRALRAPHCGGA